MTAPRSYPTTNYSTCYRCIHLRYRGPWGILKEDQDRPLDPGRYVCSLFGCTLASAENTPRPIRVVCKEIR